MQSLEIFYYNSSKTYDIIGTTEFYNDLIVQRKSKESVESNQQINKIRIKKEKY
jgi:hypothetical protein